MENSLEGYLNLQKDNSALKENLEQISLEFKNTKNQLNQIKTKNEFQHEETKQEFDYAKGKIKDLIHKIDNVLSLNVN